MVEYNQDSCFATNFVKSTIYRWFQLFESSEESDLMDQKMSFIQESTYLENSLGKFQGREEIKKALIAYESISLANKTDELIINQISSNLFNVKSQSHFKVSIANSQNQFFFINLDADLSFNPKTKECTFDRISIHDEIMGQTDIGETYLLHRACSLVFYFIGLIESNDTDVNNFNKLLDPNFEILTTKKENIQSTDRVMSWVSKLHKKWMKVKFVPINIKAERKNDDEIKIIFDLLIDGKTVDGKEMNSLSQNHWIISENTSQPFALIKQMVLEELEPIFI